MFEAEYRLRRADGRYRWVLDRGAPLQPAHEGGGYVGGCLDIDDRYREQERQRVLGVLSAALDREHSVDARRRVLVRTLVEEGVADQVRLLVVDDDGELRVAALAARDPEHEAALARLHVSSPWIAEALASGRAATATADEAFIHDASTDPEQRELRHALGQGDVSLVPLAARGRVSGLLGVARTGPPASPDALDLGLLAEVGRRAAAAIDNAQLFESEQHTSHRLALLQGATAALSAAATPAQVAQTAAVHFSRLVGTASVAVWEVRASGALEVLHSVGWPAAVARDRASVADDRPAPITDAVRHGSPVWVLADEDWETGYPHLADLVRNDYGYPAMAAVPLPGAGGRVGVVALGFTRPRRLSATERTAIVSLAEQTGQALQRAELLAAESGARLAAENFSRVVSALSRSARPAQVAEVILGHAADLGAEAAVVAIRRGDQLDVLAADPPTSVRLLAADGARPSPGPPAPDGRCGPRSTRTPVPPPTTGGCPSRSRCRSSSRARPSACSACASRAEPGAVRRGTCRAADRGRAVRAGTRPGPAARGGARDRRGAPAQPPAGGPAVRARTPQRHAVPPGRRAPAGRR
ncbi:GAF domain-containing protein [Pseudonocardia benzenivorans]